MARPDLGVAPLTQKDRSCPHLLTGACHRIAFAKGEGGTRALHRTLTVLKARGAVRGIHYVLLTIVARPPAGAVRLKKPTAHDEPGGIVLCAESGFFSQIEDLPLP